jgi:hypothetical protein
VVPNKVPRHKGGDLLRQQHLLWEQEELKVLLDCLHDDGTL